MFGTPRKPTAKSSRSNKGSDKNVKNMSGRKLVKPNVVKFSHGAIEGDYQEIVHASPKKLEKIKAILNSGGIKGLNFNVEVSFL